MDMILGIITILVLPGLSRTQVNDACGGSEFPFIYQGNCTTETCPGHCVEQTCCVGLCFDSLADAREISTCMNQSGPGSCSGFKAEMRCVAELFNSTAEICEQQVWRLASIDVLTGNFRPQQCPCENGYIKFYAESESKIHDICQSGDLCYNVTDDVSNATVYCLSQTLLSESSCEAHESLDNIVVPLSMAQCSIICDGTCREGGTGKLPACCIQKNTHAPQPTDNSDSEVLHVGFIILIVVVVIIFFVVILFGWLYMTRYRKLVQQQKIKEDFSDLQDPSMNTTSL